MLATQIDFIHHSSELTELPQALSTGPTFDGQNAGLAWFEQDVTARSRPTAAQGNDVQLKILLENGCVVKVQSIE